MKTAAIIAEYNPFHNGHALMIERLRREGGCTHIAAVMSGSFVQRGDCACADKRTRVMMALRGGVDLVVELPLPWAMSGAESFARGGVSLCGALGCFDALAFGSESGDISGIKAAARLLDSREAEAVLKERLLSGEGYASARSASLSSLDERLARLLSSPNDLLAIEYCRAIDKLSLPLEPVCVRREGASHDGGAVGGVASASFIRDRLADEESRDDVIARYIPAECTEPLVAAVAAGRAPASLSRLNRAIICRLLSMSAEELSLLPDAGEGLNNRVYRRVRELSGSDCGFEGLCDSIKCKRYTHSRIRRVVLSALLGLTRELGAGLPPYIRLLGMNARGRELLSAATPALPVVSRYSDLRRLDSRANDVFFAEIVASDIFGLATPSPPPASLEQSYQLVSL